MLTCATILLTWSLFYEMAYYLPAWCDKGGNRERKLHMINGTEAGLYFSSERKLLEPLLNLPAILLFFCPKSSQSQATVAPLAYTLEWRQAWSHRWPSATCNPSEKYALSVESHWHWGQEHMNCWTPRKNPVVWQWVTLLLMGAQFRITSGQMCGHQHMDVHL